MLSVNRDREAFGRRVVGAYFLERGFSVELECWRAKDAAGKLIYGLGEVDLFLVHPSKKLGLVVEVKARSSFASGLPLVTQAQLLRLRRSRVYLLRKFPFLQIHLGLACVKVPSGQLEFLWNP